MSDFMVLWRVGAIGGAIQLDTEVRADQFPARSQHRRPNTPEHKRLRRQT